MAPVRPVGSSTKNLVGRFRVTITPAVRAVSGVPPVCHLAPRKRRHVVSSPASSRCEAFFFSLADGPTVFTRVSSKTVYRSRIVTALRSIRPRVLKQDDGGALSTSARTLAQ